MASCSSRSSAAARPTSPKPALLTMYCGSSARAASASPIRAAASGCADVEGQRQRPPPAGGGDPIGKLVQLLLAARHQNQIVAVPGEDARQRGADAGRRAGDDRDRSHAPLPLAPATRWRSAMRSVEETPSRSATRQIRLSSKPDTAPSA